MSEGEASTSSALGKRARDDRHDGPSNGHAPADGSPEMPPADVEDSDDEIGPMPAAPGGEDTAIGNAKKRRRAGKPSRMCVNLERLAKRDTSHLAVLPHEKLFLDHLPEADRYYKSFMHRDTVNYLVVTK